MTVLTANDLKTKGVSDIERLLQDAQEVVISVRGKPRYVVMDIAHYDFLASARSWLPGRRPRADLAAGRYRREGADAHMARIEGELSDAL